MTTSDDAGPANDLANAHPERAARLLLTERDALLPILARTGEEAFGRPTACPGWSVRDVLAHCSAVLSAAASGRLHSFTPERNEADVAMRRPWPLADLLAELERGYAGAADAIGRAGGGLDGIGLGEWVHGGDVREALGEPSPYGGDGLEDALVLLAARSRLRRTPLVRAELPDGALTLGVPAADRAEALLRADGATVVRLCGGRPADPASYRLAGASPDELVIF